MIVIKVCCQSSSDSVFIRSSYDYIFFFKQKTAYEIVDCDWSSDVCSSDLITLSLRFLEFSLKLFLRCLELGDSCTLLCVRDTRSEERRVGKSVDLGGGRIIKKKKNKNKKKKKKKTITATKLQTQQRVKHIEITTHYTLAADRAQDD